MIADGMAKYYNHKQSGRVRTPAKTHRQSLVSTAKHKNFSKNQGFLSPYPQRQPNHLCKSFLWDTSSCTLKVGT
jgi:hypothetical protein